MLLAQQNSDLETGLRPELAIQLLLIEFELAAPRHSVPTEVLAQPAIYHYF